VQHLLHHSIWEQAERQPGKVSFRCRGDVLTYEALRRRAAQLANVLRTIGLGSMDRVGILMGKGIEMPVATYGVLMAGGCYVPIDPTAPRERVEFILSDCGIRILIADDARRRMVGLIASARRTPVRHVIGLSEGAVERMEVVPWSHVAGADREVPCVPCYEDDLAYVMYTSGSTGAPKGLMHTHRSGLAYARYSARRFEVGREDVLGNHAPLHFDISTFEFLTGPYAGATSVLIPEEDKLFPASLALLIERERLTFWYSVPRALIQLVTRGELERVDTSRLRWVLFGGEPFPPKYLQELVERIPGARFCNVYGPAEVNQCTYYDVPSDYTDTGEALPIGTVWEGARGLIVDDEARPIEDGTVGELLISSPTMMQGYWGRDDLNERAFHFEYPVPGFRQRYYRTGDLFRKDERGILHFLGRKDRQVKIRGYRLELDEVEAAFAAQTEVLEAAAVLADGDEGEKEIVVLVTLRHAVEFDTRKAIELARSRLPQYGIPSRVEVLSDFPRTTSGKIDRKELARRYEPAFVTQ
jgi:amino acid adenylation domain-containing protein